MLLEWWEVVHPSTQNLSADASLKIFTATVSIHESQTIGGSENEEMFMWCQRHKWFILLDIMWDYQDAQYFIKLNFLLIAQQNEWGMCGTYFIPFLIGCFFLLDWYRNFLLSHEQLSVATYTSIIYLILLFFFLFCVFGT